MALVCRLKETKEAERLEEVRKEAEHKEAEAAAEKACLEEAEVRAKRERCDTEERHIEQERQEEEARQRESHQETSLSPTVALGPELPQSKGKGPELALESEGAQESWRCNSCVRRNTECVRIKVSAKYLRSLILPTTL